MTVSPSPLQKFIDGARQVGHVSVDDIRNAFPIDTMAAEDIATIITRLEEENISVEIDPALLSAKHGKTSASVGASSSMTETLTLDRSTTSRSAQTTGSVGAVLHVTKKTQYTGLDRVDDGVSRGFPSPRSTSWLLVFVLAAIAFVGIWLMGS